MDINSLYASTGGSLGTPFLIATSVAIVLFIVWSLIWKGLALWRAAQQGSKAWFIVLLIVNTVGVLEILYLYVFSKKKEEPTTTVIQ